MGRAYACARTEALPVSVLAQRGQQRWCCWTDTRLLTTCPRPAVSRGADSQPDLGTGPEERLFDPADGDLSKRTLREKLLSYLEEQAAGAGGATFEIPLDRQGLADYLCAARSALSRELGTLTREGVGAFERSRFRLLYPAEAQNEK